MLGGGVSMRPAGIAHCGSFPATAGSARQASASGKEKESVLRRMQSPLGWRTGRFSWASKSGGQAEESTALDPKGVTSRVVPRETRGQSLDQATVTHREVVSAR